MTCAGYYSLLVFNILHGYILIHNDIDINTFWQTALYYKMLTLRFR